MSDALREAVEVLVDRYAKDDAVLGTLWRDVVVAELRAVLLANPPQDAGEGLDEARVAAVLAEQFASLLCRERHGMRGSGWCVNCMSAAENIHAPKAAAAIVADQP